MMTSNIANPNSEVVVLQQQQPRANHNSGVLEFGQTAISISGLGDGGGQRATNETKGRALRRGSARSLPD